jgi:hypothetical protein
MKYVIPVPSSRNQHEEFCLLKTTTCFHAGFSLRLFIDHELESRYVTLKCLLTFNGLYDIISEETELFVTTAART